MNSVFHLPRSFAAAAGLSLALGAMPAAAAEFSPSQKKEIESVIRDYLIQNPEVLQEALVALEKRQQDLQRTAQRNALLSEAKALYESPANIVVGNPKGDVTLVEFFDYNCGYCKRAMADVAELVKKDTNLRVVLKDFPVLGPDSVEAAYVALAVKHQLTGDKYFEYHQRLMASKGRVGKDRAMAVAKDMGLDTAKLAKDMEGKDVRAAIEETVRLGDKLALSGTPAFIVGEEIIPGAVGYEPLKAAVDAARNNAKPTR
ncbi:DsbA family protein [Chelatococcus sp. SYSU_G07232]|uniref:DsbA family protein n=1 Tax=Chelatococcus albus TaxID=3047466 RepID=A0ABT7ABF3_9HYPH|nr:DsbA family protein [Chelatococcus sp. SYSU_G07232]MDJ1156704.1 DsbA family protein [Chelatococcus sp. SYSU_G07232]